MTDVLGIHFLVQVTQGGALKDLIFDTADPEFPEVEDKRKPANRLVEVTHYIGKRCEIGFKGGLEGQVLPRGGTAVDLVIDVPTGFDVTTLPEDWQDLVAGVYSGWCASGMKFSVKNDGLVEYDFKIMSDCVELTPGTVGANPV